jgi:hypothetical protein
VSYTVLEVEILLSLPSACIIGVHHHRRLITSLVRSSIRSGYKIVLKHSEDSNLIFLAKRSQVNATRARVYFTEDKLFPAPRWKRSNAIKLPIVGRLP